MKAPKILLLAAMFFTMQLTHAQSFTTKSYKLAVHGTSSLHDWESAVEKVECTGSLKLKDNILIEVDDVVVKIPVKAIKSTKGKIMDNKTWEAFDYEKNPYITFVMTDRKTDTSNGMINVSGNLTMAGVTRVVELSLNYKILSGGDVEFSATQAINMTDFKMDPPTAMMGTIKVGPEVTISLQFIVNHTQTL